MEEHRAFTKNALKVSGETSFTVGTLRPSCRRLRVVREELDDRGKPAPLRVDLFLAPLVEPLVLAKR
jgi:hypothetical protein